MKFEFGSYIHKTRSKEQNSPFKIRPPAELSTMLSYRGDGKVFAVECPSRMLRIVIFTTTFSVCMCVTTVVLTALLILRQNGDRAQRVCETSSSEICLQCIELVQNISMLSDEDSQISKLMRKTNESIEMCCARNSEEMFVLLEIIMREWNTSLDPPSQTCVSNVGFTPVAVHKRLLPYNDSDIFEPDLKAAFFNNCTHFAARFDTQFTDPFMELAQGAEVLDKDIVINYIYLSILTAPEPKLGPVSNFKYQIWYQYVHRESPNNPANTGILLHISYTADKACKESREETNYAGGVFYLRKEDKLKVCLNGLGLQKYQKESTYFGLFMLASGERPSGIYT